MKFYTLGFICLFSYFTVSCNQSKANQKIKDNPSSVILPKFNKLSKQYIDEKSQLISNYFYSNIDKGNFSGGFLVAKNGQILYENYQGFANLKTNTFIDSLTPLHVASVSKIVTAVTVLKLLEQKQMSLDTLVTDVLEGFPYQNISLRMLLNHRSGLGNYLHFCENKTIWDKNTTLTNQRLLELFSSKEIPLDYTPNTRFKYCNTNYAMLALVVEKLSGKSFAQTVKEMVLDPLQMKNSFILDDLSKKEMLSQSYNFKHKLMRWDYTDGTFGDKNLYTTPRDLLRFNAGFFSESFLSASIKSKMFKGYSYEKSGTHNYGLGIRLIEPKNEGDLYTYHNGWWRGSRASFVSIQKDSVAIICISNNNSELAYKTKGLAKVFGNFPFLEN